MFTNKAEVKKLISTSDVFRRTEKERGDEGSNLNVFV